MAAACSIHREVQGSTALYRIAGRFEGSCAFELAARIQRDPLQELVLDFSQVGDFVDYGVAALANALLGLPGKSFELRGLRQHQERLFKYFGVDSGERAETIDLTPALDEALGISSKSHRGAA
jgi:hypothetical protein